MIGSGDLLPSPSVARGRTLLVRILGVVGLVGYNWWIPVAVHSGLLTTSDELFSDLEAMGRPWARVLSGTDLVAGLVLLAALVLRGPAGPDGQGRPEWRLLLVFAAAGVVGGAFPYVCAEGLSATCRAAEWRFQLPWRHYVHVVAGIIEFGSASLAILSVYRRTARHRTAVTYAVRAAGIGLLVGYPLLAVSYLTGRLGIFVEPLFFISFSVIVAVELLESGQTGAGPPS